MNKREYLKNLHLLNAVYARENFWFYCLNKDMNFYSGKDYLAELCNEFQDFYEGENEVLIINAPPRHGKSRTAACFCEWVLGRNNKERIIVGSYNEMLSKNFSKGVRNSIAEKNYDAAQLSFSEIFPNVLIEKGDSSALKWDLINGYNSFLATSPTGTATGFGATLLIIDDLIKSAYEAGNSASLEKHWAWFTGTMLSRLEEKGKVIIIMTRWQTRDLAGRALEHFKKIGMGVRQVCYKALQDNGKMLCSEILSLNSYKNKIRTMGKEIAEANYQQTPIDVKGKLYSGFKTYENLPEINSGMYNYTDTADTGADFLCSINYVVSEKEAFIVDVVYTKESMEVTENCVAEMLYKNRTTRAYIEANNGGRGFARSVERILKDKFGNNFTKIISFHQSKNKISRIISNSTWVQEHIYFPVNWEEKFPDFYLALSGFNREGKNSHDDAADCVTGIAEKIYGTDLFSFE